MICFIDSQRAKIVLAPVLVEFISPMKLVRWKEGYSTYRSKALHMGFHRFQHRLAHPNNFILGSISNGLSPMEWYLISSQVEVNSISGIDLAYVSANGECY